MFPADADEEADTARAAPRARRLHAYVADDSARGPVAVCLCRWDEEQSPCPVTRDVDAAWFLRPALDGVSRCVLRVGWRDWRARRRSRIQSRQLPAIPPAVERPVFPGGSSPSRWLRRRGRGALVVLLVAAAVHATCTAA